MSGDDGLIFATTEYAPDSLPDFEPEHHMRAVFTALGIVAALLAVFALLMWMPRESFFSSTLSLYRRSQANLNELVRLLFPCLTGCAIYLLAPYKRWGYRAVAAGSVLLALPLIVFLPIASLAGFLPFGELIKSLFEIPYIRPALLYQTLSTAVILAAGFGLTALLRTSQRIPAAGGVAAVLGAALSFTGRFMPYSADLFITGGANWTWFGSGSDLTIDSRVVYIVYYAIYCGLIFFSAWLVHSLCTTGSRPLNVGINQRSWFVLVIALYGALIFFGFRNDNYSIVTLALFVILLLGLVLMFIKRRAGWHIYLIGAGLFLALVLQGLVTYLLTGFTLETDFFRRMGFLLGNLLHFFIPLLTWRVIRRKWQFR